MLNIIKVILFVIVNIAGFHTLAIAVGVSAKLGFLPQLPEGYHLETFKFWYFGIGSWVFIGCMLISIAYFFSRSELKNWLLLLPMFGTGIYAFATLIYFNFIYTVT